MCLIAYQPIGCPLPADAMANGWSHNSDGAGYMFVADGKLIVRKPFFKLKHLRKAYAADYAAHGVTSPFVVHFRYATHGICDEVNTHPHSICGGEVAIVHNGILDQFEPSFNSPVSDTVTFCRTVMEYRATVHVMDETFRGLLAAMIGKYNKLVLLDYLGNMSIVNEAEGLWDGSIWYSNRGYASAKSYTITRGNRLPPCGVGACKSSGVSSILPARYQRVQDEPLFSYGPAGEEVGRDLWDTPDVPTWENCEMMVAAFEAGECEEDDIAWDSLDDAQWQRCHVIMQANDFMTGEDNRLADAMARDDEGMK